MTNQTTSIQIDSLVRILRGRRAGYEFRVADLDVNERTATEQDGTVHKFGNLVVLEGPEQPQGSEIEASSLEDMVADLQDRIPAIIPVSGNPAVPHVEDETPELPLCKCGCGNHVLKLSRQYLQGHDQRHKGILIRAAKNDGDTGAAELLVRKGWKSREEAELLLQEYEERNS